MRKAQRGICAIVFLLIGAFPSWPQETGAGEGEKAEWYQGKPIQDIVFEGLRYVRKENLEGVTQPFIGRAYTDTLFWDLQSRLGALDLFDSITPSARPVDQSGRAVVISFTVVEKPVVSRITFSGNSGLHRSELLSTVTLKTNDVVTRARLRADEQALIAKYLEKGYPDIRVTANTVEDKGKGTVTVTFVVNEGEQIVIEAFLFEGNNVFSARTLRSQLSLKAKGLLNDGAFSRAKLLADRQTLAQYYRDVGYIDAEVTDVVENVRKDAKGNNLLTLTFRLKEGQTFTFGGITFQGNKIFSSEELQKQVYSKAGEKVNARRLEADLQRISDLYYENGYLFNNIEPREVRDTSRAEIRYVVNIVERGRAHIEHIVIRGNEKTKEQVIRREIPLEEGDVFSKGKVINAQRNLYNLQYFSSVQPDMTQGSAEGLMDLLFVVEEQMTTDIQFGLTFSGSSDPDDFPISGLAKWTDRNFLGSGNSLGVELNASIDTQSASLEYTKRWLFGLPLTGGFDFSIEHNQLTGKMDNQAPFFNGDEDYAYPDGFASYAEAEADGFLPTSEYLMKYNQWYFSLGFSTGYRWTTFLGNLNLGGGIRLGLQQYQYDDLFRPFNAAIRNHNNEWQPKNSIYSSISLDQRDIYYDPSSGYYGSQRLGFYGLIPGDFEEEHYIRTDSKLEYFHTLLNLAITDNWSLKAVFGVHSGLSFIFHQPGFADSPISDSNQLAVDGMFVGRGWTGERSNYGLALWENWAEVRVPLVPGVISWDFFFDAAAIADKPENIFGTAKTGSLEERMRYSVGGGLRFAIPQMPLRFLFSKGFYFKDGEFVWKDGMGLFGPLDMDFVLSFSLSTY